MLLSRFEFCNFDTLISDFQFYDTLNSKRVYRVYLWKNIPFFPAFFITVGVHVSMEVTPLPLPSPQLSTLVETDPGFAV